MKRAAGVAFFVLAIAACSRAAPPPDLLVLAGDTEHALEAWSYCYSPDGQEESQENCLEGSTGPFRPSISVVPGDELTLSYPLGWTFEFAMTPAIGICEDGWKFYPDPGSSLVRWLGPAGTYVTDVRGFGPEGLALWTFELTTREDHDRPDPFAEFGWSAPSQTLQSEASFRASIANVAPPPSLVSARVMVVASGGASAEFALSEVESGEYCWDGSIDVRAPADFTEQVRELGSPPYDITVSARTDDSLWTATSVRWPDDFLASGGSPRVDVAVVNGS